MGTDCNLDVIICKKNSDLLKIIEFILFKFQKGAKVFNGDWWGWSKSPIPSSRHGSDIHVVSCSENNRYIVFAYGYKEDSDPPEINLEAPLMEPFLLGFSIQIFSCNQFGKDLWTYKIFDGSGNIIGEGEHYDTELEAHRRSVSALLNITNLTLHFEDTDQWAI